MHAAMANIRPSSVLHVDFNPRNGHQGEAAALAEIIQTGKLTAVFQPIMDFRNNAYIAFEGLIRGPEGTELHSPHQLFSAAERHGLYRELERASREAVFRSFARQNLPGKLFINATPDSLCDEFFLGDATLELLYQLGLAPNRIVIEITENQRIHDFPGLQAALGQFRNMGCQIAIDDLGEGFSNLRMWSEIRPDFIKIDRHFINGIAEDNIKHQFVKAMQSLAEICSAKIVAEGIESEADCLAVRDLGIALGQGYLIAMPVAEPRPTPCETLIRIIRQRTISVFPPTTRMAGKITVRSLTRPVGPVTPQTPIETLYRRFESEPELTSMPVVAEDTPLGLINRHEMSDRLAKPYFRELYGRKSCSQFMDALPLCIDESSTVQDAALLISRSARHHIYDGFIVTRHGKYCGIGSAHDLMGMITEMQIQAARYANPLTQLPGNVPINEHIDRLLEHRASFHACYFDIDNFKPFNDVFGYRRGDDVIVMLAQVLGQITNPSIDFCGHIGGDDFMVLFQSSDWEKRCQDALDLFDRKISTLIDETELMDNHYQGENRRGETVSYSLPSLSIGAVPVDNATALDSHREISAAATEAKRNAKKTPGSCLFIERRQLHRKAE
ncbi:GGDEF domain-containing protein [Propionivibrio limicola]|uniref:GGDEF domain-containing protein n=1 Tax=Propionivibrio limicola TaxID=167645 RepID=UPI0012924D63|nr:GGDEF domain-containing protein [Propionivibrio limicola]